MRPYITLLRGINVSGQKNIRMSVLISDLEELGYTDIRTYIQSGNIIFKNKEGDPGHMAKEIRQKIKEKYDFEVPTMVLDPRELKYIIDNNPFTQDHAKEEDKLYVTFLFGTPSADLIKGLERFNKSDEQFVIEDKIIFLYYPDGYGRAKINNNAFEKELKVKATTRNWKTINKLYEMT